ncbi:MAG: exodeoxyribonuclease III [Alphaproteobacteria bacterium]|nr:exodeoxyribonuclease III [Alphaproteobacteria bacterium]
MLIVAFNVNSIRARLDGFLTWWDQHQPDIVLLQEIKCVGEEFPRQEFEKRGLHLLINGQKSYNGVAIISKVAGEFLCDKLPNYADDEGIDGGDDDQARYIEARFGDLTVASIYLPNGNPIQDEAGNVSKKFIYKLKWMQRLQKMIAERLQANRQAKIILGGDFNICREQSDMYQWQDFTDDAVYQPDARTLFYQLLGLGMVDCWRSLHPDETGYSYWDLRKGRWQKDEGIRIDYFLASPKMADCLKDCYIDKKMRGSEKPSDHAPIFVELNL